MPVIESKIMINSESFKKNQEDHQKLIDEIRILEQKIADNSARSKAKFDKRGQLLPRERLKRLLDPGSFWLPLSTLAGYKIGDDDGDKNIGWGNSISGIGYVAGVRCMIGVSDAGIKGGSAGRDKINANQEITDLMQAIGCKRGDKFNSKDIRYEKIIIMTDADVDGAHISTLLMAFFYKEFPKLIDEGHLYLSVPPLYKISKGAKTYYAVNDKHKDEIIKKEFKNSDVTINRFKGLGEMMPAQLKETTMSQENRTLLKVQIASKDKKKTHKSVDSLMGKKPELRFKFIVENSKKIAAESIL